MDKKGILEILDDIDTYMSLNLNENYKFVNPGDMYLIMHLDKLKQIKTRNDFKYMPEEIVARYEMTKKAFDDARNQYKTVGEWDMSYAYYEYIDNIRKNRNGITNEQDAMEHIRKAVITNHLPKLEALNYTYNGLSYENQIKYSVMLLPRINAIYDAFKEDKENALVVQNKQTTFSKIISKIKSFFNTNKSENEQINNTIINSKNGNNFREELKQDVSQNKSQNSKEETQYIAVSDLHGNMDKWNSVKNLLQNNPNIHIYMLGDAMDRGEFGLEILLQIKELSDEGRITYLPGNHDIFAYDYMDSKHAGVKQWAKINMERNGGEGTMNKLDNFEKVLAYEMTNGNVKHKISKEEFRKWLGSQPIQMIQSAGKYTYAMAHALFDLDLYNYKQDFNLADALNMELSGREDSEMYKRFKTAMWYRQENEEKTKEAELSFPEGWIAIVGHTPQQNINLKYVEGNPYKPMICIDTGKGPFKGYNITEGKEISFEKDDLIR